MELAVLGPQRGKNSAGEKDDELSLGHSEFRGSAERPGGNRKHKTKTVGPVFGGKFSIQSVDLGVTFMVLKL